MQVRFRLFLAFVQLIIFQIYNVHCAANDSIQRRQEDILRNDSLILNSNRSMHLLQPFKSYFHKKTKASDLLPNKLDIPKKTTKQVSKIASKIFYKQYSKNLKKIAHNSAKLVKTSINSLWVFAISIFNIMQASINFTAKKLIVLFDHPSEIVSLPFDALNIFRANIQFPFEFVKHLF